MRHVLVLGTALFILAGANQGWADNPVDVKPHEGDPATEAKATSDDAKGSSPDSSGERGTSNATRDCGGTGSPPINGSIGPATVGSLTMPRPMPSSGASRNPQPTYSNPGGSYSGGSHSSVWGQERFNQYGQPQYPYSQLLRYSATRSSAGDGRCAFLAGMGGGTQRSRSAGRDSSESRFQHRSNSTQDLNAALADSPRGRVRAFSRSIGPFPGRRTCRTLLKC